MQTQRWPSDRQLADRWESSRPTIWRWVTKGLLPPPVKFSAGTSRWPPYEIDAIEAARLAGSSDDDVRELVKEILANRLERKAG